MSFAGQRLVEEIEARERLERENEVLRYERDFAQARYEAAVRILSTIHNCLAPPEFTDADGKRWRYEGPEMKGMLQMLSDRIRAIPDELDKIAPVTTPK